MSVMAIRRVRDFSKIPASHRKKHFTASEVEAFDAHGWHCHYCGSPHALTADHIVPRAHGGTDEASNLVPACAPCNTSRGKRDYHEFMEVIEAERAAYVAMVTCGDCA